MLLELNFRVIALIIGIIAFRVLLLFVCKRLDLNYAHRPLRISHYPRVISPGEQRWRVISAEIFRNIDETIRQTRREISFLTILAGKENKHRRFF